MKYFPHVVAVVIISALIAVLGTKHTHRHRGQVVKRLKPRCEDHGCNASYAVHDSAGDWWIYTVLIDSSNSSPLPSRLPAGGDWTKSDRPVEEEEVEAEEDVQLDHESLPEEMNVVETVDPTDSQDSTSDSGASDSSSDPGSSDSGGGDGGGGDGGGD